MAFDLSDYVQVHERLQEFWTKHPDWSIETFAEFPDDKTVLVRAVVSRDNGRVAATGHAEEVRVGRVNEVSAVENCETSAVGRALANLGLMVKRGVASREEMQKVQRAQEAKKAPVKAPVEPPKALKLSKVQQTLVDRLVALSDDDGMKTAVKLKLLSLGVEGPNPTAIALALTEAQVQDVLSWMEEEK